MGAAGGSSCSGAGAEVFLVLGRRPPRPLDHVPVIFPPCQIQQGLGNDIFFQELLVWTDLFIVPPYILPNCGVAQLYHFPVTGVIEDPVLASLFLVVPDKHILSSSGAESSLSFMLIKVYEGYGPKASQVCDIRDLGVEALVRGLCLGYICQSHVPDSAENFHCKGPVSIG